MAELSERDAALLLDMLLAARNAQSFVQSLDLKGFLDSPLHQSAAIRAMEVIGEAARKVSVETQSGHPGIPWRQIIGMRHRLIHGYNDVQLDVVWTVIHQHVAPLISALEAIVPPDEDGSTPG